MARVIAGPVGRDGSDGQRPMWLTCSSNCVPQSAFSACSWAELTSWQVWRAKHTRTTLGNSTAGILIHSRTLSLLLTCKTHHICTVSVRVAVLSPRGAVVPCDPYCLRRWQSSVLLWLIQPLFSVGVLRYHRQRSLLTKHAIRQLTFSA